jgi:DMSO/TMAO reductase YedYZ molybdopterin-dependent catalytic subunit
MSPKDENTKDLYSFFAQDPEAADKEFFGRVSNPDRRGFLKKTGLATMGAMVGATIPFHRNMPMGFVPAAMAQESVLVGKDGLTLLNDRPVNAETPPELLDDAITPTSRHFVRNNGIPPEEMDAATWELTIDGFVDNPMKLTIADLKSQFEVVTLALALECGGNGRGFFNPPAKGNQWTYGAVACSEWTGVRLKDVLEKAGVQSNVIYTAHHGADSHLSGDPTKAALSRGVPIEKAMTDNILIAFEMNGAPLHPMNGAPLRLVVPGWPASTAQKWLKRIQLRDIVHDGAKMTGKAYRVPNRKVSAGEKVEKKDFVIIERMPVKSLVTFPANGVDIGMETDVRGHAWAGDRTVSKLEVSLDFGATWQTAELDDPVNSGAWQNWRTKAVFDKAGYYEIWARATDSDGVMQPFAIDWNPKGYLNNTMHRVGVRAS